VLLGPTEHRVARWLADRTHHGRITIRTVELANALRLERSEAYRITARLRILGLFGVENDRGGTKGGRRYWRTSIAHDGAELDCQRHREAWARIVAWARGRRDRIAAKLAELRPHSHAATDAGTARRSATPGGSAPAPSPGVTTHVGSGPEAPEPATAGGVPGVPPAGSFAERMRRHGLGGLMDQWGLTS
jgi:hypothetical protein